MFVAQIINLLTKKERQSERMSRKEMSKNFIIEISAKYQNCRDAFINPEKG